MVIRKLLLVVCYIQQAISHRGHVTNWLKSKPNEGISCADESLNLMCDHYEGIRVTESFWGRDNDVDCQVDDPLSKATHKEKCFPLEKNAAFQKVENQCQDKTECTISAPSLGLDMEFCPHIKKFLRVKYECRQLDGM